MGVQIFSMIYLKVHSNESKLLLVRKFIFQDRYFSIDQLNQMIESFYFGYSESKNRPSLINLSTLSSTDDNSLKQSVSWLHTCICVHCIVLLFQVYHEIFILPVCFISVASQVWCLGRFLPTMIGDWVLKDNENW